MQQHDIPGTTIFDGDQAQKGFALNRMCFSFNSAENRAAFLKDEDAYCRKYALNEEQRAAVKSRQGSVANRLASNRQAPADRPSTVSHTGTDR